jgi:hypothetical protein
MHVLDPKHQQPDPLLRKKNAVQTAIHCVEGGRAVTQHVKRPGLEEYLTIVLILYKSDRTEK